MKVIAIFGITNSGKTTTVEHIVSELRRRNYSVGSVKEIHFEKFAIDTEGTNTHRHKMAGSQLVTARGMSETDVLYQEKLSPEEILAHYDYDFVILEGVRDCSVPKIIAAHTTQEVDERLDETVFAVTGRLANQMSGEYRGLPIYSALTDLEKLVDLIENVADDYEPAPWAEISVYGQKLPLSFAASRELGTLLSGVEGELTYKIKKD